MAVLQSLVQKEHKLELEIDFFVFDQAVNLTLYRRTQGELIHTDITPLLIIQDGIIRCLFRNV